MIPNSILPCSRDHSELPRTPITSTQYINLYHPNHAIAETTNYISLPAQIILSSRNPFRSRPLAGGPDGAALGEKQSQPAPNSTQSRYRARPLFAAPRYHTYLVLQSAVLDYGLLPTSPVPVWGPLWFVRVRRRTDGRAVCSACGFWILMRGRDGNVGIVGNGR